MAKNMKTIKFGENGEVYNVNEPAVIVNGTLDESASEISFGPFDIPLRLRHGTAGRYTRRCLLHRR